ncbi:MAG: hypothetical protein QXL35_02695 [Candidatus Bathyarchaeia archaeon]
MSSPLEERIRRYFMAKGFTPFDEGSGDKGFRILSFRDGEQLVQVAIMPFIPIGSRTLILSAAMSAMELKRSAHMVYLALPKLYASMIDGEIFEERGLGLITFDERRLDEAIPAKEAEPESAKASSARPGAEGEELRGLRAKVLELEALVKSLDRELRALREMPMISQPAQDLALEEPLPSRPASSAPPSPLQSGELPSYFKDNPWLEILAKRGREGPDRYVG